MLTLIQHFEILTEVDQYKVTNIFNVFRIMHYTTSCWTMYKPLLYDVEYNLHVLP